MKKHKNPPIRTLQFVFLCATQLCLGCRPSNSAQTDVVVAMCACKGTDSSTIDDAVMFMLGTNFPTPLRLTLLSGDAKCITQGQVHPLVKDTRVARAGELKSSLMEIEKICKHNPSHRCPNGIDASALAAVVQDIHRHNPQTLLLVLGPVIPNSSRTSLAELAAVPTWWLETPSGANEPDPVGQTTLVASGLNLIGAKTDPKLFYSSLAEDLRNGNPWNRAPRITAASIASQNDKLIEQGFAHSTNLQQEPASTPAIQHAPPPTENLALRAPNAMPPVIQTNRPSPTQSTAADHEIAPKPGIVHMIPVENATLQLLEAQFHKEGDDSVLPENFVGIFFNDDDGAGSLELHLNQAEKQSHAIPGNDCSTSHLTWRHVGDGKEQVLDTRGISSSAAANALITISRRLAGAESKRTFSVRVVARVSQREFARTIQISPDQSPIIPLSALMN